MKVSVHGHLQVLVSCEIQGFEYSLLGQSGGYDTGFASTLLVLKYVHSSHKLCTENASVTMGSHSEGSGQQGTSLQEQEATAGSVKQPRTGCRTSMTFPCTRSSSDPVCGIPPNHQGFSCSCSPSCQCSQAHWAEPQLGNVSMVPLPYMAEQ